MTYKEFKEKYTQKDVDKVIEFLDDLADSIEKEEPHATQSIECIRQACFSVSLSLEDE